LTRNALEVLMAASTEDPFDHTSPDAAEGLKDQAQAAAEGLKRRVRGLADDAQTRARATVNQEKDTAAERLHAFASTLRSAADELKSRHQHLSAGCVEHAADGLEGVSGALRGRDLDELVGSVEDFARRQPAAFLGGALLTGLALARFMKSSAERRSPRPDSYPAGPEARA
jgi:hypothetical protein